MVGLWDLKNVYKIKMARFGYCLLTGRDTMPLLNERITLASDPVSILFDFPPVSDVVLHTLNLPV